MLLLLRSNAATVRSNAATAESGDSSSKSSGRQVPPPRCSLFCSIVVTFKAAGESRRCWWLGAFRLLPFVRLTPEAES